MEAKETRLHHFLELSTNVKTQDLCERLGISPSYMSQIKHRKKVIGDDMARRIERALNLPTGYMDTTPEQAPSNAIPADVLSIAFAVQAMPETIREAIKRLVFAINTTTLTAASACSYQESTHLITPFRIEESLINEQSHSPKKANQGNDNHNG